MRSVSSWRFLLAFGLVAACDAGPPHESAQVGRQTQRLSGNSAVVFRAQWPAASHSTVAASVAAISTALNAPVRNRLCTDGERAQRAAAHAAGRSSSTAFAG